MRFVVPTSTRTAPDCSSTSGMRKPPPDLHQLAAGDDDLAPGGERGEGEQDGGGVVVHGEAVLGAGQPPQQAPEVRVARPAAARLQVELERRVAARDRGRRLEARPGEGRPPQVGVQDHAGGVDHRPERRLQGGGVRHDRVGAVDLRRPPGPCDERAVLVEHGAGEPERRLAAVPLGDRPHPLV